MYGYLLINDTEDIGDVLQEVELHNRGPEASGSAWGVFELDSWRKKRQDVRNTTTCGTVGAYRSRTLNNGRFSWCGRWLLSLRLLGKTGRPTTRTVSENEHSDLPPGGIAVRSLCLLAVQILVNPIADDFGEQLLSLTLEPLQLCLVLGWSGE